MDGMLEDLNKITISACLAKLFRNKLMTFIAFTLLIAAIVFIEMHPYSVWYYFAAGFFTCRMLELISEKSIVKNLMQESINRINKLKAGLL